MQSKLKDVLLKPVRRPIAFALMVTLSGIAYWYSQANDDILGQLHLALAPRCPLTSLGADDESASTLATIGLAVARPVVEKAVEYGMAALKEASESKSALVAARVASTLYKESSTGGAVLANRCVVLWRSIGKDEAAASDESALDEERLKKVEPIIHGTDELIIDYVEFALIVDRKNAPAAFRAVPAFMTSSRSVSEKGLTAPITVTLVFESLQLEGSPAHIANATFTVSPPFLPSGGTGIIAYPDRSSTWFPLHQPYVEAIKSSFIRRTVSGGEDKETLEQEERIVQNFRPFSVFATMQWDVPGSPYLGTLADVISAAKQETLSGEKNEKTANE